MGMFSQCSTHLTSFSQSRSRNRKINFKTRIPIKRGDVVLDDPETLGDAAVASAQPETHVETGVDKEEEHVSLVMHRMLCLR